MKETIDSIINLLPLIIPLVLIQFGLVIAALIHILRHETYKQGNRVFWVVAVFCLSIIGPVLYFIIGRDDSGNEEDD